MNGLCVFSFYNFIFYKVVEQIRELREVKCLSIKFRDELVELEDVGYDESISKDEVVEDAVFRNGTITSEGEELLLKNHGFTRSDVVDEEGVDYGFIDEVVNVADADLFHGEDAVGAGYIGDGGGARYYDIIIGD